MEPNTPCLSTPQLSYAICVCNEVREIGLLLTFLDEVRDKSLSEIVILVDSTKSTKQLVKCLKKFEDTITVFTRDFDGDFAAHKNFLNSKCKGSYIFNIDADEIPQENLIRMIQMNISRLGADLIFLPRINICPGYTRQFLERWNFSINNAGWINWPDFQGRIYKNSKSIKWVGRVHEKIQGASKSGTITQEPDPSLALWHVKDVPRQNFQNESYNEGDSLQGK